MLKEKLNYIEELIESSLPEIEKSINSYKIKGMKDAKLFFNDEGLCCRLSNFENEMKEVLIHNFSDYDVSLQKDYVDSLGINLDKFMEDYILSEDFIKLKDEESYFLLKKEKIIQDYLYSGYEVSDQVISKIESSC